MRYLLSIETGLGAATLALLANGVVVARAQSSDAHANATETIPLAEQLLMQANISFDALEVMAAGIGPGSFTGIRIGLAAARGFALAAKKPLIGVNTLEATAYAARGDAPALLVALDAMRGQLYTQTFQFDAQGLPVAQEDAILRGPDECNYWLAEHPTTPLAGNAQSVLQGWLATDLSTRWHAGECEAGVMGRLAWAYHLAQRETMRDPLYVRAPDAKLPTKKPLFS